ncbi:zinc-binding dehydrogenase [uncultured Friedmanniella sp.]|uniref:zinc-dependent alcohol dehydrogenase n=1 Tax=uncultured Friedmanniella sp. TaxID=335381 RepID=UPI0035CA4BB0
MSVEERPQPDCPPGWVLVQPELVGLCGSDFSIVGGHHGRAAPPLVLGHEMVGTVAGSEPGSPPPGTRVVVNPLLPCGQCWSCRNELPHVCRNLRLIGIDLDGALAELLTVPAGKLLAVDPATPVAEAALTEPLAVAVHAVRRAALSAEQTVLVIGAGPIGVLIGLVAEAAGCRVMVSEPHPTRRRLATDLGLGTLPADVGPLEALSAATGGQLADVTFDCAGRPPVAALLSAVTRVRGTIVLAGLYGAPAAIDLHAITFAEQALIGSRVYTHADFGHAISLVEGGTLVLGRLAVQTFPLDAVGRAFEAARQGETLKVLVDVRR